MSHVSHCVESWDCVATVFFIDTAHNIVEYIETIWNILKPGGYWVNFGEAYSEAALKLLSHLFGLILFYKSEM